MGNLEHDETVRIMTQAVARDDKRTSCVYCVTIYQSVIVKARPSKKHGVDQPKVSISLNCLPSISALVTMQNVWAVSFNVVTVQRSAQRNPRTGMSVRLCWRRTQIFKCVCVFISIYLSIHPSISLSLSLSLSLSRQRTANCTYILHPMGDARAECENDQFWEQ